MDLASYSQDLAKAAGEAGQWVSRNSELVRNEKEGLLKELRRAARKLRACGLSASRNMSTGVFGPSQAGKSYLISVLAQGRNSRLIAKFGSREVDFVREINPDGGKESTGLVTRFTMTEPARMPEEFPVYTRLLTETDIVKILANTWFEDCKHEDEDADRIKNALNRVADLAKEQGVGIDLDAMEDLREYFQANFRQYSNAKELERLYWDEAIALAQRLDLEGRIQLYSIIWNGQEEFTEFLRTLLTTLAKLDFTEVLYCPLSSLIPKDKSIIDVANLHKFSNTEAGKESSMSNELVEVCAPNGVKATMPRYILTALIAELTIVMKEKPAPYFEYSDLLDFPGYRSRYTYDNIGKELKKDPRLITEMYLRGKVAYLFQRYVALQELNNMLLCIGPSNQEVVSLPGVISNWIAETHGATPEDRVGKTVSLMFILTKFDAEFEQKAGSESPQNRPDIRLKASLLDFFGRQADWPAEWTPGKAFNNIFLLRNPNIQNPGLFNFSKTPEGKLDKELSINADSLNFVEQLHSAFLGSELVNRHVREASKAWDAMMEFNDGGISYIRDNLAPICDPAIKEKQLLENVNNIRRQIAARLKAFYTSDDKAQLLSEKQDFYNEVLAPALGDVQMVHKRFGQLLHLFTITDSEIREYYPQAKRLYQEKLAENSEKALQQESPAEPRSKSSGTYNPFKAKKERAVIKSAENTLEDETAFFADYIMGRWVERLHALADDEHYQRYFALPNKAFNALVSEIATGASRLGLKEQMIDKFRKIAAFADTSRENMASKQSTYASRVLNNYINWLGIDPAADNAEKRSVPLFEGETREVFILPPPIKDMPKLRDEVLNEDGLTYTDLWLMDWLDALAGLIVENVNFDGSKTVNVAENAALGKILDNLNAAYSRKEAVA